MPRILAREDGEVKEEGELWTIVTKTGQAGANPRAYRFDPGQGHNQGRPGRVWRSDKRFSVASEALNRA
jgi:hypothetical protein